MKPAPSDPPGVLPRVWRATRDCHRALVEQRRDLWLLSVWLVLVVLLGDDLVLWVAGTMSEEFRATLADWGPGVTTLVFGGAPAVALGVALLQRDWRDAWRRTKVPTAVE